MAVGLGCGDVSNCCLTHKAPAVGALSADAAHDDVQHKGPPPGLLSAMVVTARD